MTPLEILIPFVFTLAAIFYALLGLYAWRRRPAAGVVSFAWVMLSMSLWSFTYGLEIFFSTLDYMLLILNVEYIGIISVPVFIFFFALDYTGRAHLITPRFRFIVWAIASLFMVLIWTNPLHQLMWSKASIIPISGMSLLDVHFEIGSRIQILLSVLLLVASGIILTMEFLQRPGALRLHISFVIMGIAISIFAIATFYFRTSPLKGVDFTPLFFLPAAIGLAWSTLRYSLSEALSLEYISVLKNMQDGVIVLNGKKRILYINPVIESLLHITEDEVIGQPFEQIASPFKHLFSSLLDSGEERSEVGLAFGDAEKTFEASVSSLVNSRADETNVVLTLHDITLRKEKEHELSRHSAIMSAISRAAEEFLKSSDWEKNIPGVLKDLGIAADVSRVYVVINSSVNGKVLSSLTHEWAAPGVARLLDDEQLKNVDMTKAGFARWVKIMTKGHMIHGLVQNFLREEADFIHPLGTLSLAIVPVFVNNMWWAFLAFDEVRSERQWTTLELDAFRTAASIFGAAELHSRTAKKLINRQRAMGLLQEIVTVSLQADTLQQMAETITERLAGLIDADGCFLTMWDETNLRTIPLAAYGPLRDTYAKLSFPPSEQTFTRSVLESESTLAVEDVENSPYVSHAITGRFPTKSALALPLITKKGKLGALIISFETRHRFDSEEIEISEQAAGLVALALEKFQAMEEAKRRADTSETLRKAGVAIAEKLEMDQALIYILEQLNQVVPYDSASVQMLEGNELVIVGGRGWQEMSDVLGVRFTIPGDNPNSEVIRTGKPLAIPEPWRIYKTFKLPPSDHIRSWLGVPLIAQQKTIGLLAIDRTTSENFKEIDVKTAAEFADQVAVTLENVRLFKETQTQALTDALTGIYNRRGMYQIGEFEFQRSRRINRPFSLMIFDIDHFKEVNDTHGHPIGDQILQQLANLCVKHSRATDLVIRYGGEEFIILLSETTLESARIIAERLRYTIKKNIFPTDEGDLHITTSIGVAEANRNDTLDVLIERADAALYQAKRTGRDKVIVNE